MKFALVNGERREAEKGLLGSCIGCESPTVAKCGAVNIHHWSHKSKINCDRWWEPETPWHRDWKGHFPKAWQEIRHVAEDGELHIADVKTDHDWVLEFQHSHIEPQERQARNTFYKKLVWVVDGVRRKTDLIKFTEVWKNSVPMNGVQAVRIIRSDGCALLRDWSGTTVPVFFDFGEPYPLFFLFPNTRGDGSEFVAALPRNTFIESYLDCTTREAQQYLAFMEDAGALVAEYQAKIRAQAQCSSGPPMRAHGYHQHFMQVPRPQRRFRF